MNTKMLWLVLHWLGYFMSLFAATPPGLLWWLAAPGAFLVGVATTMLYFAATKNEKEIT